MRIYILNLLLILCCIILMIATHPPACRDGKTPLKLAIDRNKPDVMTLLRSVGASHKELFRATALPCTALDCMPVLLLLLLLMAMTK